MIFINLQGLIEAFNRNSTLLIICILVIDFTMGTTNKIYANSILESVLRLVGWAYLKTFRLKNKKLSKRRGLKRD